MEYDLSYQKHCRLCPRQCAANRTQSKGFCGGGALPKVARAALHFWEEPCISGEEGSGAVFFSGCPLQCCYCQNDRISAGNFGEEISIQRLGEIFLELAAQGANNINLVTASQYVPEIIEALKRVKPALPVPIVYNSSGYESLKTLRLLEGWVDIYLPDLKYFSPVLSARYSHAEDYFQIASAAILEMFRQVGATVFDQRGILSKGLIIRHLVLPNATEDSVAVLRWIKENLPLDALLVSVMSQYTPFSHSDQFPEINRRLTRREYQHVLDALEELGIENGFVQELSSAKEEYTPDFSLQGVRPS